MVKSIEDSDYPLFTGRVHIFDDCSEEKTKQELLDNLSSNNILKIHRSTVNLGTVKNTIPNIDKMFDWYYDTSSIIVLQDDTVVSKNWYSVANLFSEQFQKLSNAAILSLYNRVTNKPPEPENRIETLPAGHPGGVAYMITRKFWTEYKKHYDINDYGIDNVYEVIKGKEHRILHEVDYKLCQRVRKLNGCIGYLVNSIVQHTGDISTLHNRNMSIWRAKNFIGDLK
jgi:hypothetical protein